MGCLAMGNLYNEAKKQRFMTGEIKTASQTVICNAIFVNTAPFEASYGKDLCFWENDELLPLLEGYAGLRTARRSIQYGLIRKYIIWCRDVLHENVSNAVFNVRICGENSLRRMSVANPAEFQEYLDAVYVSESQKTVDCIYRCYMWLAYCGIKSERDAFFVKCVDVDTNNKVFSYKNLTYLIFDEAVPAFEAASRLPMLKYQNAHYGPVYLERARGLDGASGTLIRGLRPISSIGSFRTLQSRLRRRAVDVGRTEKRIGYLSAYTSGCFYRQYATENHLLVLPESNMAHCAASDQDFLYDYERWRAFYYPN